MLMSVFGQNRMLMSIGTQVQQSQVGQTHTDPCLQSASNSVHQNYYNMSKYVPFGQRIKTAQADRMITYS